MKPIKYEGYFKKSSKKGYENYYIQKIYENGEFHIIMSNKIPEAGFYECEIIPMKPPKKGYIVISFVRNLEKENQSYQQYLKNKKNKLKNNAQFSNIILKKTDE